MILDPNARDHILEILADHQEPVMVDILANGLKDRGFYLFYDEVLTHCRVLATQGIIKLTYEYDSGVQDYVDWAWLPSILDRMAAVL